MEKRSRAELRRQEHLKKYSKGTKKKEEKMSIVDEWAGEITIQKELKEIKDLLIKLNTDVIKLKSVTCLNPFFDRRTCENNGEPNLQIWKDNEE